MIAHRSNRARVNQVRQHYQTKIEAGLCYCDTKTLPESPTTYTAVLQHLPHIALQLLTRVARSLVV